MDPSELPIIKGKDGQPVPYVHVDLSRVRSEVIDINTFFSFRKNPWQRFTPNQSKRNKKIKKFKNFHALDQVNLIEIGCDMVMTDKLTNKEELYKKGEIIIANSHTRRHDYQEGLTDKIPLQVYGHIYTCYTPDEVHEMYKQYDSRVSHEKNSQKIYGALSSQGFHPKSKKIISGNFLSGLNFAYGVFNKNHLVQVGYDDYIEEQAVYFMEELKALDLLLIDKKYAKWDMVKIASYLCAVKRYKSDEPLLKTFFRNITAKIPVQNTEDDSWNGSTHVNVKVFENRTNLWDDDGGFHMRVSWVLYCLEKFMEGKKFKKAYPKQWKNTTKNWLKKCEQKQQSINYIETMFAADELDG